VSDLNKEGTSANADLLAAKDGKTWQIQVKGATEENGFWFGYGHCNEAIIAGTQPMFNHSSTSKFYKAEVIVLVSVKSPREYSCVVLPVEIAEQAAQLNLDREFRTPKKRDGGIKKPGKVWISLDWIPKTADDLRKTSIEKEVSLLKPRREKWDLV
jgi:hypothetical protein